MEENESVLSAEFQTKISEKDLMNFKMYDNFHSFAGIGELLFSVFLFAMCAISLCEKKVNIIYAVIMGILGLFFTIYPVVKMKIQAKQQMKSAKEFREPVKYLVTEEKIKLSQGEVKEDILWEDVCKIKCTGKSLILYMTSTRANIIPLISLGAQTEVFLDIAAKKLKHYQLELNREKVIKNASRLSSK